MLPTIGAVLPAGGSLFLRPDGAIERAYVPEPGTLRVNDVALRYEIRWVYPDKAHQSADNPPSAVELRGDLGGRHHDRRQTCTDREPGQRGTGKPRRPGPAISLKQRPLT